jgi:YD repeat-containing protein
MSSCPKCGLPFDGDVCPSCSDSNSTPKIKRKRFRLGVIIVLLILVVLVGDYWVFRLVKWNRAQALAYRNQIKSERADRAAVFPCLYFTYSAHDGVKTIPGVRSCYEFENSSQDESQELFRVDLLTGELFDRRTDFYLKDAVPIEFERVVRAVGGDPFGFGKSGTHSYDKFLMSRDMHVISVISNDVGIDLYRTPWWLPFELLDRWVGEVHGKRVQMIERVWPYDHLDMELPNRAVESYMVCDNVVICYLNGYRDASGQELHFERDARRRLNRLSSPHQWLNFKYDAADRITSISDSLARTVQYIYNAKGQLVEIDYPSGEVLRYTYDDAQHVLTFSAAPDTKSKAVLLMSYTYDHESGRIQTQTLADGSTYQYIDTKANGGSAHFVKVIAPDDVIYDMNITEQGTILHRNGVASAVSGSNSK